MPGPDVKSTRDFRRIIYSYYKREGRTFPWRERLDPWGVLLSEFMLQQTQVGRVTEYWKRWMEKWPRPEDIHNAGLDEILREWSGLGYNRRAKYLKDTAGVIALEHNGRVPETPDELVKLPGIGRYCAGAIACFSYNYPSVFIETNIRAVFLHFYFFEKNEIPDKEIFPLVAETLDKNNPRKWYWALMDYGAALKKLSPNPNRRSAHYTRQGGFEGSFRQVRGSVIRALASRGPASAEELRGLPDIPRNADLYGALNALTKDAMIAETDGIYRIV